MSLLRREMERALTPAQREQKRLAEIAAEAEAEYQRKELERQAEEEKRLLQEREQEAARLRQEAIQKNSYNTQQIGNLIEGKGVYLGVWYPRFDKANPLSHIYNVFAAPEDLTMTNSVSIKVFLKVLLMVLAECAWAVVTNTEDYEWKPPVILRSFKDTAKTVAGLKDWHGYDGGSYDRDNDLYAAMKDGRYKGEWFIPSLDLLYSIRSDVGDWQAANNRMDIHNFSGFKTAVLRDSHKYDHLKLNPEKARPNFYWFSTPDSLFSGCNFGYSTSEYNFTIADREVKANCRPCRAEPVPT